MGVVLTLQRPITLSLNMMTMSSLFVLLALTTVALAVEEDDLRLELASVLFRHGDRSPVHVFPTDQYTESSWPQGFGQLSLTGMEQQYRLGEIMKARYANEGDCRGLVCSNYTRVQVHVTSTDVDRTLMSVGSQLSALFPPEEDERFNSSILWQPIPVHTTPSDNDTLLRPLDRCPAYDELRAKDPETPEYKKMEAHYKDFLENISSYAGMTLNLDNIWIVQDTVFIESVSEGYDAPEWATEEVMDTLHEISSYTMTLMFNGTEKHRLSAGNWLKKIHTDMENKIDTGGNVTFEDMKLFLYSAHDTTVAAMTSALGVFNQELPGYATAFAVELYSDTSTPKKYYVKMLRRDGPDSNTFEPLTASYCAQNTICTLEEFANYVTPLFPRGDDCHDGTPSSQDLQNENHMLKITVITIGSALGIALLIVIIITVLLISACRKNGGKKGYSNLHTET